MTDLTTMKSRVADELARSDLTSQIASAITTAIEAYQNTRFWFNENRDITFSTVADQEFYDSDDESSIPDLLEIDWITLTIGNNVHPLRRISPKIHEDISNDGTHTGQPFEYSYYQEKIRLYPVPSDAWTIRIAALVKLAAPATDGEADNDWMTNAERLIRSRAKAELALHVIRNRELAADMRSAEMEALDLLKGRTNRQTGTGEIRPYC